MENIDLLACQIQQLHLQFQSYALKQVNQSLTLRNWLIGNFIVEFEQDGSNRAAYGQQSLAMLADRMSRKGLKSFRNGVYDSTASFIPFTRRFGNYPLPNCFLRNKKQIISEEMEQYEA